MREVVPRTEFPNFRDHGMNVEAPLMRLLCSLSRRYGEAFVAESGLRQMICEDVRCPECGKTHPEGHMAGVDTIPQALERLELQGLIAQEWLFAGGLKPDGEPCGRGMRLIRVATNRQMRFAFAARARSRNRREGVTRKVELRRATVEQAQKNIGSMVRDQDAHTRELEAHRKRQEDAARLRELEALWAREAPEKPPD